MFMFPYLPVHVHQIPFLYTILTNQGGDTTGYKIVANMMPQLSVRPSSLFSCTIRSTHAYYRRTQAICPVIIVLLVSLDRTHL
jgi:hypothetical protein